MSTIRDVAKEAGASVSAVSEVLHGNGSTNIRVGAVTRKRILNAASSLGYTPNQIARSLVTRKNGVIGLVFPYSSAFTDRNPFCTQVMTGVFEEVVRRKYNLMLHTAIGDDWDSINQTSLLDRRVDGLLLVIPRHESPVIKQCIKQRFPYVAIASQPSSTEEFVVNADDYRGGYIAAEHLLSLGHTKIMHLRGDPEVETSSPREKGFLDALKNAGIDSASAQVYDSGFDRRNGFLAMSEILAGPSSEHPTAIFAANDLCAEGVLHACKDAGVDVPGDISLVGYDDTWFAAMTRPSLTSIHMPIYEMAVLAAQMLIARIEGEPVLEHQPVLPIHITIRESCGAPPTQNRYSTPKESASCPV